MENKNAIPRTIIIDGIEGFNPIVDTLGNSIKITFEKIKPKAEPKLPETWEELETINGFWVNGSCMCTQGITMTACKENANVFPTREEAEASIALAQLLQLRNAWGGRYYDFNGINFRIVCNGGLLSSVLAFPNIEIRDRFQSTFSDLIKTASPLL